MPAHYLVGAERFAPQPFPRCSRSNSFQISLNYSKIWEAISGNFFLFIGAKHFSHNLSHGVTIAPSGVLLCVHSCGR